MENLTIPENTTLVTMDVTSLYTNIPHDDGIAACRTIWEQRTVQEPPTVCLVEILTLVLKNNPIVTFDRLYQKTSKALGVSYTSVYRIMNGKRPCKSNRPKERAEVFVDFDHCIIKSAMLVHIAVPFI
jgi:hypothetical protein